MATRRSITAAGTRPTAARTVRSCTGISISRCARESITPPTPSPHRTSTTIRMRIAAWTSQTTMLARPTCMPISTEAVAAVLATKSGRAMCSPLHWTVWPCKALNSSRALRRAAFSPRMIPGISQRPSQLSISSLCSNINNNNNSSSTNRFIITRVKIWRMAISALISHN